MSALTDEYGLGEEGNRNDSGEEPEEKTVNETEQKDESTETKRDKKNQDEEPAEEGGEETEKEKHEREDATTKDRLAELGFYDNDFTEFPPELSGIKRFKVEGNSQPIIEGLDLINSVFMKHEMVEALGRIPDKEAVEKLIEQVDDNDTREQAIEALGIAGSDRATDKLVGFFDPEKRVKPHIRAKSAEAVGRIGDPDAIEALVTLLTGEGLEDTEEQSDEDYEPPDSARVRGATAEALGTIGEPKEGAVGALVGLLETDTDETVRLTAARSLSKIEDKDAHDALEEYKDDRNELIAQKARKVST